MLVEGRDEHGLFNALFEHLGLTDIESFHYEGNANLDDFLKGFVNMRGYPNVSSIGVSQDAETNPSGAFNSIKNILTNHNLNVAANPMVKSSGSPTTVIHIIPSATTNGMIETVLLESIKSNPEITCIDDYILCLNNNSIHPKNIAKSKVHAYLSSKDKAGLKIGEAANIGYWNLDDPAFDEIKKFIHMVCS